MQGSNDFQVFYDDSQTRNYLPLIELKVWRVLYFQNE